MFYSARERIDLSFFEKKGGAEDGERRSGRQ